MPEKPVLTLYKKHAPRDYHEFFDNNYLDSQPGFTVKRRVIAFPK